MHSLEGDVFLLWNNLSYVSWHRRHVVRKCWDFFEASVQREKNIPSLLLGLLLSETSRAGPPDLALQPEVATDYGIPALTVSKHAAVLHQNDSIDDLTHNRWIVYLGLQRSNCTIL